MKKKVAIIGSGSIAKCLSARLASNGVDVCFSLQRHHVGSPLEELLAQEKPQAVFLAISTIDKGQTARDYMLVCINAGIPIITCEKGALAYHAGVLKPHFNQIGFSATVGGGTRMLKWVKERCFAGKQVEVHAVVNGTLNFIFDQIRHGGRSLGEACREASRLRYAGRGEIDPLSLINGELRDVRMKTCVFFNTALANNRLVAPDEFGLLEQTSSDLETLNEEGGDYRMVVSFLRNKSRREHARFGRETGLHFDGWHITWAFRQITQTSRLASWLPGGIGNAVHIIEGELGSGGKYTLSGPGEGREPITSAMLADFAELCH